MKLYFLLVISIFGMFLAGCPPTPPPNPPPDLKYDLAPPDMSGTAPSCPANTTESPDDVCDGMFASVVKDGKPIAYACVRCTGGNACVDHSVEVYCTAGPCASDPLCHFVPDSGMAGAGNGGAGNVKARLKAAPPKPVLPKSELTPGATDPHVTQANIQKTICVSGYTKSVRPPVRVTNKIKVETLASYNIHTDAPNDYELDHLISLELGGAPADVKNLWPEPWESRGHKIAKPGTGAESKDKVETWLKRQVCADKMPLAEAQRKIATNWAAVLEEMKK